MTTFKSTFNKSDDNHLFNEFLKANEQMNPQQAEKCIEQMSDEGLLQSVIEIDNLAKNDPGYTLCNVYLFSAFVKRPHLRNPFQN